MEHNFSWEANSPHVKFIGEKNEREEKRWNECSHGTDYKEYYLSGMWLHVV
jgi:hypothetical protein